MAVRGQCEGAAPAQPEAGRPARGPARAGEALREPSDQSAAGQPRHNRHLRHRVHPPGPRRDRIRRPALDVLYRTEELRQEER